MIASAIDFGVATGITSIVQLGALGLLVLVAIVGIVFFYKKTKQESEQKNSQAKLKQEEGLEQRQERVDMNRRYISLVNDLSHTLNTTNDNYIKLQETLLSFKENFEDKLSVLTNEYISELNETMTLELIELTLESSKNKIILFCAEVIQNNHISENEKEVNNRIDNFVSQEFSKNEQRLSLFKYSGKPLNEALDPEQQNCLAKGIKLRIIAVQQKEKKGECHYDNVIEQRNLNNFIRDTFEGFKVNIKRKALGFKKK